MVGTFWALLPPIIAIALALLTKEVYISLLVGIVSGALLFTNFNILDATETTFTLMGEKIGGNANIIIFLVLLGILVALMTKSGASRAYGDWASRSIKTKRGALLSTIALGILIFVDDYFNCLTVGTVMRPVTDRNRISRAKLAYIIDATAAPVCIIAPISSWAAAVGSSLPEGSSIDGFSLFLRTIPANFYALLTIAMMLLLVVFNLDFSKMKKYEVTHADEIERYATGDSVESDSGEKPRGRVLDLIIPIAVLIVLCILAMLYTGGILEGKSIIDAFGDCNASLSLVYGAFFTLIITFLLYIPRKVVNYKQFTDSIAEGFKAMVPAVLILSFAWTLGGICSADYLDAGAFVSGFVSDSSMAMGLLPLIFFLVALGLAFATGTSWGTFGILIPIIIAIFNGVDSELLVITTGAVLAGAVCGDHISPISDTTILASTGANCNHIDHVSTQIPYAMIVAGCCAVGYLIAGLMQAWWLALIVSFAILLAVFFIVKARAKTKA